jgi:hypothetical protein
VIAQLSADTVADITVGLAAIGVLAKLLHSQISVQRNLVNLIGSNNERLSALKSDIDRVPERTADVLERRGRKVV